MSWQHRLAFAGFNPETLDRLVGGRPLDVFATGLSEGRIAIPVPDSMRSTEGELKRRLEVSATRLLTDLPAQLSVVRPTVRWLFVRGEFPVGRAIAVIGSRRATTYGVTIATRIGRILAASEVNLVSGLALGVDGAAHRGALEGGGRTTAVLGCGIDCWYPLRHAALGEEILARGGAVISEFPPGTPPEPWRFPARNRIIAGLVDTVIVVEAAERSGALITARIALELGKEVLAVPGDIDRPSSLGCNRLIRDGAYPIDCLADLPDALGLAPARAGDRVAISFGELLERWDVGVVEGLARLGRLESDGLATIGDDLIRIDPSQLVV